MSRENTISKLVELAQLRITAVGLCCLLLIMVVLVGVNSVNAQVVVNNATSQSTTNLSATTSIQSLQREAEQSYDRGLRAYLKEDYVTAHSSWLMASQKKHAKSQFNLALMHERQQVPNGQSSREKALSLYKQAANANYQPAYVYWARLVEKDNPELAQRIRSNIQQNQAKKARPPVTTPSHKQSVNVKTKPIKKTAATSSASSTKTPLYRRDNWILQQPDERWTVQLVAYRNETKLLDFIDRFSLVKDSAYFTEYARGVYWYKLIYGVYTSKADADAARSKLPQTVRNEGPWLRQFKEIKTVIRQSK